MMNALGGIVVNKSSVPDNFRQVDTFNTEVLSKLWKVYSVNRDIVDKGRRLENVFWRIWGSERTGRPLSGRSVSDMFMRIQNDDVVPPRRARRSSLEIEYRKVHRRQHPSPSEAAQLPPPSLEIECPPTPPPSPIPNTLQRKGLCDTYLSKFPPHSDLTTSILHAFPYAPPSPPPPRIARQSPSPTATRKPSPAAAPQNPASLQPSSHGSSFTSASPSPPAATTAARLKPRRTISKKPVVTVKKRGLRPPGPRTKSSSSTKIPSTTATATTTPSTSPKRKPKTARATSAESAQPKPRAEPPQPKPAWIVDPDFRTKYIERQENVLRAKAPATTALSEGISTAQIGVKRGDKGKGKGKKGVLETPSGVAKAKPGFLAKRQKSELTMLFEGARKGQSSKTKP